MMKPLFLLASAILSVSAVVAAPQNGEPLKVKQAATQEAVTIPDDAVEMYAFQLFGYGETRSGFLTFPSYAPEERTFLCEYGITAGDTTFRSGAFVEDTYYTFVAKSYENGAILEPVCLATVDIETGKFTPIADYSTALEFNAPFYEMSYDPKTRLIYAIQTEFESTGDGQGTYESTGVTKIWTIDPHNTADLLPKHVATINDHYMWTMAVDNGVIYGIVQDEADAKARLISINTETIANGTCTVELGAYIDGGNRRIDYSQSMEFDHTTHNLWWAGQGVGSNGGSWICKINTTDGSLSDMKNIPEASQYIALGIPYQTAADGAPSYVIGLNVKAGEKGASGATLTWKNPSTNYALATLTQLSGVKVYRNGELLTDLTNVEIGAEMTYTDSEATEGNHVYKLLPYNNEGEGIYRERNVYVGVDVPAAPADLKVVASGTEVTISWTAPTIGLRGGYIDVANTTYDVVRMPDNVTVATGITETTVKDEITTFNGYSYSVTAKNSKGEGGVATSNTMAIGPGKSVPYVNAISTEEEFNELTILDNNNDNNTWYFTGSSAHYQYNPYAPDDYIITPSLSVIEGNVYEVQFDHMNSNYARCVEKLKVLVGNAASPDALTEEILDLPELLSTNGNTWHHASARFTAKETGGMYVAFKIYSDADMGTLDIKNIVVRHVSQTDLRAESIYGSDIAYVGTPLNYGVDVSNTGMGTVKGAVVKLMNSAGTVIGQTTIDAIYAGETRPVYLTWTPTTAGKESLSAVIEYSDDTFVDDNKTTTPVAVEVVAASNENWFSIGVPNNQGYRPIYLEPEYSQMQTLYYAKDFTMGETTLYGMQYAYKPLTANDLNNVPLTIHMMNTDLESLDGLQEFDEEHLVFDGTINIPNGSKAVNYLTIKFDKPFEYAGSNVLVKVVSNRQTSLTNVEWLIINEDYLIDLPCHSYSAFHSNEELALSSAFENDYIPYIRFAYDATSAVNSVDYQSELTATKCGDMVLFNMMCDVVEVYSVAGQLLYTTTDVDNISVAQLNSGIYILRATSDSNTTVVKFVK